MKAIKDPQNEAAYFKYNYLDQKFKNDTFQKIFEVSSDSEHFYILTQNNRVVNMENSFNPFYSEITVSRVKKAAYFPR